MDEAAISTLEQTLADVGTLLVQAEKYVAAAAIAQAGGREASALGAEARRLLRREALDTEVTSTLQTAAAVVRDHLRAAITAARAQTTYEQAVGAYRTPDDAALSALIPRIFSAVERVEHAPSLFVTVDWTRRGRARSPADLATTIIGLHTDGMIAEGDDLTAGADATLQAVMFSAEPPEDEAVVLRVDPTRLDAPLFQHTETGTYLVYRTRAHLPFVVHVASTLDLDVAPSDFPAFRGALIAALCDAGVEVAPDDEPELEDEPST